MSRLLCLMMLCLLVFSCFPAEINSDASFVYFVGDASWYAEYSPGVNETTANMEIFDHDKMTCAMWGLPFDTIVEVTNVSNGRSVSVRVNDRGPAPRYFKRGRIIDLTKAAFERIEGLDKGLVKVRVRIVQ